MNDTYRIFFLLICILPLTKRKSQNKKHMYEANLFEQNRKYFFLIFKRTENDYETLYLTA